MNRALSAVESVVIAYLKEADAVKAEINDILSQEASGACVDIDARPKKKAEMNPDARRLINLRKDLRDRAEDLRGIHRRSHCLEMAHTCENPLAIDGEEIDTKPYLLPCANGVLDLKTGDMRPGRPDDMLLKACPVAWEGIDAPCPTWEQTVQEIMSENETLCNFVQRFFGFALIGEVSQSVFVILTGQGRNGKSMLVNTIFDILGPLARAIRPEMLLDQGRVSNSAGPSADIMALKGARFVFGSETDEGCRISSSRVKWLTGNDVLSARSPNDKYEINFRPTHTLFLLTNHVPNTPPDDFAFWERVLIIPFNLSFVNREPRADNERRADRDLPAKLREELPGILAWMVRGCLQYQLDGLRPPAVVLSATAEKRRSDDILADFVDDCLVVGDGNSASASDLYSLFEEWWIRNISKNPIKQKKFGMMMMKRYSRDRSGSGGTYAYHGIGIVEEAWQEYVVNSPRNKGKNY